uniref:Secreted protein n=1 Tax=Triticum urartu TaxID=4572 RepID=A0A8R7TT65_TRIUA
MSTAPQSPSIRLLFFVACLEVMSLRQATQSTSCKSSSASPTPLLTFMSNSISTGAPILMPLLGPDIRIRPSCSTTKGSSLVRLKM